MNLDWVNSFTFIDFLVYIALPGGLGILVLLWLLAVIEFMRSLPDPDVVKSNAAEEEMKK